MASIATIVGAMLSVCDARHMLRSERLMKREAGTGALAWIWRQMLKGVGRGWSVCMGARGRIRRAFSRQSRPRERHGYFAFRREGVKRDSGRGLGGVDGGRSGAAAQPAVERMMIARGDVESPERPLLHTPSVDSASPSTPRGG
jgi:hypothetical protein